MMQRLRILGRGCSRSLCSPPAPARRARRRAGGPIAGIEPAAPVAGVPAPLAGSMLDPERGVLTLAPLLAQITPGVVNIAVRSRVERPASPLLDDPFFRRFFDLPEVPRQRDVLSAGSGVIVDARRGYVLTNSHVVANADRGPGHAQGPVAPIRRASSAATRKPTSRCSSSMPLTSSPYRSATPDAFRSATW